jgi:2-polyprenyl-6-methoxyphenol hydroxylase-like FAD-dependent oxidoreductase
MTQKALVIGGGIAGPVTALALQQAGIEATIYEAYAQSSGLDIGAYLTVAVNGIDALRTLGLDDSVRSAGFPTSRIEFFSGRGRRLGVVPIGGCLPDGTVTHTLKRADLYRILDDAIRARGIEIEHGKRLVDANKTHTGGVAAVFADGTRAYGDVLIGADGIHSAVRSIIDAAAPNPRYTGLGNIGGFSSATVEDAAPGAYRMVFGKRCFFGYAVSPSGEVWWFGNPPREQPLTAEELRGMTSEVWKERMIDLYRGDASPAVEIVRATTNEIGASNQYEMPSVPHWHRDSMIVIGDAAHAASPTSGQGASMAIEDGIVLAQCLRDNADLQLAFSAYEQQRRERVERVVAFGAERNAGKMPGPAGRMLRDLVLPMIFKRHLSPKAMAELGWLFDHHITWDAPTAGTLAGARAAVAGPGGVR